MWYERTSFQLSISIDLIKLRRVWQRQRKRFFFLGNDANRGIPHFISSDEMGFNGEGPFSISSQKCWAPSNTAKLCFRIYSMKGKQLPNLPLKLYSIALLQNIIVKTPMHFGSASSIQLHYLNYLPSLQAPKNCLNYL